MNPEEKKRLEQSLNIYDQWKLYLHLSGYEDRQLPIVQERETKRSFMAGIGQMLMLMRNEIPNLSEDEAVKAFDQLIQQVSDFWIGETNKQN